MLTLFGNELIEICSFFPLEIKFKANILRPPNDERRVKRLRSGRKFLDGETKTNEYLYRGVNSKN